MENIRDMLGKSLLEFIALKTIIYTTIIPHFIHCPCDCLFKIRGML